MNEPDDAIHVEPQDALRILIESDGYALLIEHVRSEWGTAAQLRKIRDALERLPVADHSATTQSIIATSEAIMRIFAWPEEEHRRLRTKAAQPKAAVDRFAEHRRTE